MLPQELIGAYVKMIVRLETDPKTANPKRISSLTRIVPLLSGEQLGLLIMDLVLWSKQLELIQRHPSRVPESSRLSKHF